MNISWKIATAEDVPTLSRWNHQLIRDEGHRNAMTVPELEARMRGWLETDYKAVLFTSGDDRLGYALYRFNPDGLYLRQFLILGAHRRKGIGRECFQILRQEIWPKNVRLIVDVLCHNTAAIEFWRAVGFADYALTLEIMPPAD